MSASDTAALGVAGVLAGAATHLPPGMRCCAMDRQALPGVVALEQTLSPTPWTARNFSDSLAAGHAAWVVLEQDACVGYAVTTQVLDEMELLIIGVALHKQRQGLGFGIMQMLMQIGRCQGAGCLHLEVRASNRAARALYARCGFAEVGRRRNYYTSTPRVGQPEREDALLMRVSL